jgi:hypothetical protein
MVTTSTSGTSNKDGGVRGIAAVGLAATVVVLLFVWIVGASMSAPKAHDLTFGLVGPPAAVTAVEGAIAHADPGGFTTSSYPDEAAARQALARQDIHGALVLGRGNDLLLVTGASGDATKQAATAVADKIAATSKAQLTITDIAPLPNGDQHGLLAFTVMVGTTLAGLVFQLLLSLRYPRIGRTRWLLSAVCFSAVAGLGAATVSDLGIGAFGGQLWPVAGVAALLTLVSVTVVAALQRLLGPVGLPLSTLLLVQLGIATSGGPVPREFLPGFYRALSPFMPGSAEVLAVRRIAYLPEAPVGTELLVLVVWAVAAAAVTLGVWTLRAKLAEGRVTALADGPAESGRPAAADLQKAAQVQADAGEAVTA